MDASAAADHLFSPDQTQSQRNGPEPIDAGDDASIRQAMTCGLGELDEQKQHQLVPSRACLVHHSRANLQVASQDVAD